MNANCETISLQFGELFQCSPEGQYLRIRTPFLYPDGDFIDVFLSDGDSEITVSDLGETNRWLRMQTTSLKRSENQRKLIQDVCLTQGVESFRGMLSLRCKSQMELGACVTRLAQACVRVADLWFTFRTRAVESISDEVADWLSEQAIPFDRAEKLVGRSGRDWHIDFHVRTKQRSSLVNVLSSGSRSAARRVAEHSLAAWHDLNNLVVGPERLFMVSLFDDTQDVWSPEDFKLLESISDVAFWSRPDQFRDMLVTA